MGKKSLRFVCTINRREYVLAPPIKSSCTMKIKTIALTALTLFPTIAFFGCLDDSVGGNFYTFTGETMESYLEKDTATFSEFLLVLEKAELKGLLSSYGTYTLFAPTNNAMKTYYQEHFTSLDSMNKKDLQNLVFYQMVEESFLSNAFTEGRLSKPNMKNRGLNISFSDYQNGNQTILVNKSSRIVRLDQEVHNGVIHAVDKVLEASQDFIWEILGSDTTGRYDLFARALRETGLADSLLRVEDPNYVQETATYTRRGVTYTSKTPLTRKYGYTALVETDSVFALAGINSYSDLIARAKAVYDGMYPADVSITDITNPKNSLNRFIGYHLVKKMFYTNTIFFNGNGSGTKHYTPYGDTHKAEYFITMCPNTMYEISAGNCINKRSNGSYIGFSEDLSRRNIEALNGLIHEINGVLWYNREVEDDVLNKRLRFEVASLLPEMENNNLRGVGYSKQYFPYQYFETMTYVEKTVFQYYGANPDWGNYQGDELNLAGWYDFTLQLPPIPAGSWEVRFGYGAYINRGVAQLYFDKVPCGIPLNMSLLGTNALIGWEADAATDDNGYTNDKAMRNRGYMKGPESISRPAYGQTLRDLVTGVRRILGTFSFDETTTHTMRAKAVESGEFMYDYIEFIPKGSIENEDRY